MTMTLGEKVVICKEYDSLLNTLMPLEKLMTPPLYPNLINYDNYKTGAEEEHKLHVSLMAKEISKKISTDQQRIEEYIKKPDFFPKLNVRTNTVDKNNISIEDTILYRNVYETTIVREYKKPFKFGKNTPLLITKFRLIKLSKELYYLEEITLETTRNVYDYICGVVEAYASSDILNTEFDKLVWLEIKKRGSYINESKSTSNYLGLKNVVAYIIGIYGIEPNQLKWYKQGKISIDNRKRCVENGQIETLEATFRKK